MAFPATPLDLQILVYFGGSDTATDVSVYVHHPDKVTRTLGKSANTNGTDAGSLTFTLQSPDGLFNPRNPESANWTPNGWLGDAVEVNVEAAPWFVGKITDVKTIWDQDGFEYVSFEVRSPLYWGTRNTRFMSTLKQTILGTSPLAYWTITDADTNSVEVKSALTTQPNMPTSAFYGTLAGLDIPLGDQGGAAALFSIGALASYQRGLTASGIKPHTEAMIGHTVLMVIRGTIGATCNQRIATWRTENFHFTLDVVLESAEVHFKVTGDPIAAGKGGLLVTSTYADAYAAFDGLWHDIRIHVGPNTSGLLAVDVVLDNATTVSSGTDGWYPTGQFSYVTLHEVLDTQLINFSMAHLTLYPFEWSSITGEWSGFVGDLAPAMGGYVDELISTRVTRVAAESGTLNVSLADATARTAYMDIVYTGTLSETLEECEHSDAGRFNEAADGTILYEAFSARYCVDPTFTLTATDLIAPPSPSDEAGRRCGAAEVSRYGSYAYGTAVNQEALDRYGISVTDSINVMTDNDTRAYAEYLVNRIGADLDAVTQIEIELAATNEITVGTWVTAMNLGLLRIVVTAIPHYANQLDVFVDGVTETIDLFSYRITANCSPARMYDVAVIQPVDSAQQMVLEPSIETTVDYDTTATTMIVRSTAGPALPLSADYASLFPVSLNLNGERVSCTACAAGAYSYVGVGAADHDNWAAVTPALHASTTEGDLLLLLASCGNKEAYPFLDEVANPGWVPLLNGINVRLFGKIAAASEAAPTVYFGNGATGDTTSAQVATFRGPGPYLLASDFLASTASANIIVPQLTHKGTCWDARELVIAIGWKGNAWSSATPPAGFTEITEYQSSAGATNPQSVEWAYLWQSAYTNVPEGTITVTGGATDDVLGAVVAIRADTHSLTVTRSVNDVVRSHPYGSSASLWFGRGIAK